ncbi:hypothetical protein CDD82_881 [Ophiocordyceps australis]|uniref:tRNA-splicing endonuclease subunit Sen54 N-terminal domain-containing protein n=1 Tax=Ophiocordyceps australis TaxID=1399860 RepID=A0A2C5ZPQ3_9HYPO|nr:hypothetical protein CDD82_881 [Ophiocordyceps australis]
MAFDDDDNPASQGAQEAEALLDVADDDVANYELFASMFNKKGVSSKSIRRGEKDFESHGTRAQSNALESSRQALEEVLSFTRTHRTDTWTRGWFFPAWWEQHEAQKEAQKEAQREAQDVWLKHRVVVVEHDKGNWAKDTGRTVPGNKTESGVGKLWLLPEEALFLVERGTLHLWWPDLALQELLPGPAGTGFGPDNYDVGLPLSLEAAYCMLVGYDDEMGKTSLPKYQVYAHLKRAGYHVLRAPPLDTPDDGLQATGSLWQWLLSLAPWKQQSHHKASFGPLVSPGLYRSYQSIYRQLTIVPRHVPTCQGPAKRLLQEPFQVHYHVWKPGGAPFSKRNPRMPDFRIAVADTSDSCLPTLEQIDGLLSSTPADGPGEDMQQPARLYQRLKHGHRNVVVAIVDRGLVNFMRFGEGAFGQERLFERFDAKNRVPQSGKRSGHGARGRGRGRGRGRK